MKMFLNRKKQIQYLICFIILFIFYYINNIYGGTCTPTSATLCINGDDHSSVWINGNYAGGFTYVNWDSPYEPACVNIPVAWLNATGDNVIAIAVTDTAGGQIWGSFTLDVTCSGGQHAYISSNDGGMKLVYTNIYNSPPASDWYTLSYNDSSWGNAVQVSVTTWAKPLYNPADGRRVIPWSYSYDAFSGANEWDPSGQKMLYFRKHFTLNPVTPLPSPTFTIQKSTPQSSMIRGGPVTFTIVVCVSGGYTRNPVLITDWWTSPTYCAWSMGNPYYYNDINEGILYRDDDNKRFTLYFPLGFEANTCKTFVYELNPCWFTTDWYCPAWCTAATNYARVTWTSGTRETSISVQLYCPSPSNTFTRTRTATMTFTPQMTPSFTSTRTSTPTITRSPTFTYSRTSSPSPSPSRTMTPTPSRTPSPSPSRTLTPSPSPSPSHSRTATSSFSRTPSASPSLSPSSSHTPTPTYSRTPSPSPSRTATPSPSRTPTPSPSPSLSPTPSRTATVTFTRTYTPSPSPSASRTPTLTYTRTPAPSSSPSPSRTPTASYTGTPTSSVTLTPFRTPTPTYTRTPSLSPTNTNTRTRTPTPTLTFTDTISSNTPTVTPTHTRTYTRTLTSTNTNTRTATLTYTNTVSPSPTNTRTPTPTYSRTPSPSSTNTNTRTRTPTSTFTDTISSNTPTITPTRTRTYTVTQTLTFTSTSSQLPTNSWTPTRTATASSTFNVPSSTWTTTRTPTLSRTQTATSSQQSTRTMTPTQTFTDTISSNTPTITQTWTPTLTMTQTYTETLTATSTRIETATSTITRTATPTRISTWTSTVTLTATDTLQNTATNTQTITRTYTDTRTPTVTQTGTSTWTVTLTPTYTATETVTATSTGTSTETNTYTMTPTITNTPEAYTAELGITLLSYGENAQPGAMIEYKIIIENRSSNVSAFNIRVWDTLPAEVEYVDSYFVVKPIIENGVIIWEMPYEMELKPGERIIIELRVKMTKTDGQGFITNIACADYQDGYYNDTFGTGRHPVITSNINEYPEEPIIAYPNPYKINGEGKWIKFVNIPPNSTVQIYTVSGENVISLSTQAGSRVAWDGKNKRGQEVSTGIYYYVIINKSSKEIVTSKIFIIK